MPRQLLIGVQRGKLGSRAAWHLAALQLWRLWQSRGKLRKRALIPLVLLFVPLKLKVAAFGAVLLMVLLVAGTLGALIFALTQLT
jgi:hypothetical protein